MLKIKKKETKKERKTERKKEKKKERKNEERKNEERKKETSPGGQKDASVVDLYMKSMFFSDFGPVLGGFDLVLTDIRTDGRTDGRTNPLIEMRGRI